MVRPPREFREAAWDYVCVRVLDMKGVDLDLYRFDYDLTFAAVLMNPDGTIYHHYGGRDTGDPAGMLAMRSFAQLLKDGMETHAEYMKNPKPPAASSKRPIESLAPMARRMKAAKQECIHCHTVNDVEREVAQADGSWTADRIWKWPSPAQIGMSLDPEDQVRVTEVVPGSPLDRAGVKKEDRLIRLGGRSVRSFSDVQRVLEETPNHAGSLLIEFEHMTRAEKAMIPIEEGWKTGTPLTLSWRPSMWGLRPNPGFGGPMLTGEEKAKLGLPRSDFAIRIQYLITWGDHPEDGRNALKAGFKKDDVVLSVAGKKDFQTTQHFQAWFRLTQKPGTDAEFEVLREGKVQNIRMKVIP
ncbi:MAG: PDZ domain-containing protein [Planctomycetes bacterium]|nr:PDZ domain-containing protein [Planctomycetota bacterium]